MCRHVDIPRSELSLEDSENEGSCMADWKRGTESIYDALSVHYNRHDTRGNEETPYGATMPIAQHRWQNEMSMDLAPRAREERVTCRSRLAFLVGLLLAVCTGVPERVVHVLQHTTE